MRLIESFKRGCIEVRLLSDRRDCHQARVRSPAMAAIRERRNWVVVYHSGRRCKESW